MQERIEEASRSLSLWRNVIYLPAAGSTNDVAKELAAQGAPEGTVVVADEQTAGRGRMGRRWLAPPGTCLLCSLLFRPQLPPARANQLTMLCSLAAADAVEQITGLPPALKWPNDLITKSPIPNPQSPIPQPPTWKKLAGILTETGVTGKRLEFAIVGIGINANVPPDALPTLAPDATSILAETGREVDRVALLAALLAGVEARRERLRVGESPRAEWAARLTTLGQRVDVTTSAGTLTGVAESVDEDGALLLRASDGALHRLLAGDVTLSRPRDNE
ncbi:MAG: biotin--[acetyl-CoA-carboxylase] ligase [Chloroflexota bacterium]|nr:biotin--[acetyl-CoA-carboxylase] ligase [Chloroflexota bacterium]